MTRPLPPRLSLLLLLAIMALALLGTVRASSPRRPAFVAPGLLLRSGSGSGSLTGAAGFSSRRPALPRIQFQQPRPSLPGRPWQHPPRQLPAGGARLYVRAAPSSAPTAAAKDSDAAAAAGVTGAGDIGPCPLLEAERLFPTVVEFDLPPPVAGHCLALRLPRITAPAGGGDVDGDGAPDISLLTERSDAALGPAGVELLHPDELRVALQMGNLRNRMAFVGGRLALRRNLRNLPKPPSIKQAVLRDATGAPILPERLQASISHKDDVAVCLLRNGDGAVSNIGVDVEVCQPRPRTASIAPRVLTEKERLELGALEGAGVSVESELLLRFSLKESVYKAIHPFVRRYVSFHEAEVTPLPDGTAAIRLHLKPQADGRREGPFEAQGLWRRIDGGRFFLTTVVVSDPARQAQAQAQAAALQSKL